MSPALVVLVLSLLLGIQPVTTDLYLPALPALTAGFGAPVSQAQLTLTALLLAFGFSQLLWGPLSDRFGRRPVLLWGLGLYTLSALMCLLAPTMQWLIIWRAVQGAAMGAAVMCARAIVRDLYGPIDGARVMAKSLGGLGIIACISPPLGGLIASTLSWRVALAAVTAFGVLSFSLVAWRFVETVPPQRRAPLNFGAVLHAASGVLRHPTFIAWNLLATASYAGLFTFLAASSFVFIHVWGVSKGVYGLAMASTAGVYILGTVLCRRLLPRMGARRAVRVGAVLTFCGGTAMGMLSLAGVHTWWAFLLPQYLFMLGHGIHQPCAQSGAVSPFPRSAGTASALNGVIMMVVAFGVGQWLGWRLDGTTLSLVHGVWFWSMLISATAWTLVQRHGDVPSAPLEV